MRRIIKDKDEGRKECMNDKRRNEHKKECEKERKKERRNVRKISAIKIMFSTGQCFCAHPFKKNLPHPTFDSGHFSATHAYNTDVI